jgi:hypothetical protein
MMLRILAVLAIALAPALAYSRDLGQFENSDPATKEWFRTLMQPDAPTSTCCGEADGYWCDVIHVRDGKTFCTITDDRPDEPLRRPHMDVGTQIEIPNHKLKWDRGNPTGHAVVFIGNPITRYVYCFVQGSGL